MPRICYDRRFGITQSDWQAIQHYCNEAQTVLMFRGGKASAIPWIEKRMPAKPMSLEKVKVDPEVGLLLARTDEQLSAVAGAGCWVLKAAPDKVGDWIAVSPIAPTIERARLKAGQADWAQKDLVVCQGPPILPITSDYDLAAVIPQSGDYRQIPSRVPYGHDRGTGVLTPKSIRSDAVLSPGNVKQVLRQLMGASGWENPWTERVRHELNKCLGDERIQHGPQALYVDPSQCGSDDLPYVSLANAKSDDKNILAFRPDGEVDCHWCENAAGSKAALDQYM